MRQSKVRVHWRKECKAIRPDELPKSEFLGKMSLSGSLSSMVCTGELNMNDKQESVSEMKLQQVPA